MFNRLEISPSCLLRRILMNFLDLVKTRQSVRNYLSRPVEKEKIDRCLEAARFAPSANNAQPWKFIVIDEPELKEKLAHKTFSKLISFNRFSLQAPVLVLLISQRAGIAAKIGGMIKNKSFELIDIGIAAEHFCLQATEEGLGTCMLGWFDETGVKKILHLPKQIRVELIITMGYPESGKIRPKKRKTMDQIVSYNQKDH